MSRVPKPEWVKALRDLCGSNADLFFNEQVGRWAFMIPGADGVPRAQFWGQFDRPTDPVTGLHPFRELDDEQMRIALHNLAKTYVGNDPLQQVIEQRNEYNRQIRQRFHKDRLDLWNDMYNDRRRRIEEVPFVGYTGDAS